MGPRAIRYADLFHKLQRLGCNVEDLGHIDVVEINPIIDRYNRTAELATELLASLMGQSIL